MSIPFSRSIRALAADDFRPMATVLALAGAILIAWLAWFFVADVAVYVVSDSARVVASRSVHPLEAPVSGQVSASWLELGRWVDAGEVLVTLDTRTEQLQLEEEAARLATFVARLEALQRQIRSEIRLVHDTREESAAALSKAEALQRSARAAARYAEAKSERWASLHAEAFVSDLDVLRVEAEAEQLKQDAEAINLETNRLEHDRRVRETSMLAFLDELQRDAAQLQGEIATAEKTVARLEYEVDLRTIRAPVAGRLGMVARIAAGTMVDEGERLGALVPSGELEVAARFVPADALGRVAAGQPARLRLDGFPWTQYGSVPAEVIEVASEPEDGRIEVTLRTKPQTSRRLPLNHGLPGSVEVEVERVSPATLVLRAAGRLLEPETAPAAIVRDR